MNKLNADVGGKSLGFLGVTEIVQSRRVCKSMAPAVDNALREWIQPSGSALLDPIRRSFETRFGEVRVENAEAVNLRARNIRNTAIATIRKAAPLLKQGEWAQAGIDPSAPKEEDFDRIHAMIRDRRAENLVRFFEWMGTQEGMEPVREFVDSLSIDLSLLGKARAIRAWLAEEKNAALLDGIVEIPMRTIFPGDMHDGKRGIPVEILKLRGLTSDILEKLFITAIDRQNLEVVQALLVDRRFLQFEVGTIGLGIQHAALSQFGEIVLALIGCARFKEIPGGNLGEVLCALAGQGKLKIVQALVSAFVAKKMQDKISMRYWIKGLETAVGRRDMDMLDTLAGFFKK